MNFIINKLKEEKGSVIIELAIFLPILLSLTFGYISFMKGVENQLIMQTAVREAARAYANPIENTDMSTYAIGVANSELNKNNIKGATVTTSTSGSDRSVKIEKPYSTIFPFNNYILKMEATFHVEPFDEKE